MTQVNNEPVGILNPEFEQPPWPAPAEDPVHETTREVSAVMGRAAVYNPNMYSTKRNIQYYGGMGNMVLCGILGALGAPAEIAAAGLIASAGLSLYAMVRARRESGQNNR